MMQPKTYWKLALIFLAILFVIFVDGLISLISYMNTSNLTGDPLAAGYIPSLPSLLSPLVLVVLTIIIILFYKKNRIGFYLLLLAALIQLLFFGYFFFEFYRAFETIFTFGGALTIIGVILMITAWKSKPIFFETNL